MGIVRFNDLFRAVKVKKARSSSRYSFIDGNLYWHKRRLETNCSNMTANEFSRDFIEFLCDELLRLELRRGEHGMYQQVVRRIELIFDSKFARNFLKMWCCYKRIEASNKSSVPRIEPDLNMLRFYLKDLRETLHMYRRAFDEKVLDLIDICEAPIDTDDYIVSKCMRLLAQESNLPRGLSLSLGEEEDLQSASVGSISIFSVDTDFLSYFPFREEVGVYSTRRSEEGEWDVYLLNAEINMENPVIAELDKFARQMSLEYEHLTYEYVFKLMLKFYAMLSPNDYITCSFFDSACLRNALYSVFLWYRKALGRRPTDDKKKPEWPARVKTQIVYDDDEVKVELKRPLEGGHTDEPPAKRPAALPTNCSTPVKRPLEDREESDEPPVKRAAPNNGESSGKGNSEVDLILAELPISCLFAYWTCYLDKLAGEGGAQKHLALVNNILRVFIVAFKQPPAFKDCEVETMDCEAKIKDCEATGGRVRKAERLSRDQTIDFSLLEFQHAPKIDPQRDSSNVQFLHTIEELDCALAHRWLAFYDRDFCQHLENNYKRYLSQSLSASDNNQLPKKNLVAAIRVWFNMRACYTQNKYICGLSPTDPSTLVKDSGDNSVKSFLRISSRLTNYFTIFMAGLGRIWFFEEHKVLADNISRVRSSRMTVSSQWFKLCCMSVYDFFMPCDRAGKFVLNSHETVAGGLSKKARVGRAPKAPGERPELVPGVWTYDFEAFYENAASHVQQYI